LSKKIKNYLTQWAQWGFAMDAIDLIENRIAKEIYFCALKVH